MKKGITVFALGAFLVLLTASAFAQPRTHLMRGRHFMKHMPALMMKVLKANQEELKITDEQLDQVQALMDNFHEKTIQVRSQIELQRLELKKLFRTEKKKDYTKIKAQMAKMSDIRQNMIIERMKHKEEIMNVFTPEQQDAMKAMFKDRMQRRRPCFQRQRMGSFQRQWMKRPPRGQKPPQETSVIPEETR
jgi:Spy/CpxP family protein refolding chaperone